MKWVAVTMMRTYDSSRHEWRDAIDARWMGFLAKCDLFPLYLPNNIEVCSRLLAAVQPSGGILTGGGNSKAISGNSDVRDETESCLIDWATSAHKPLLGVCRGMQVILSQAQGRIQAVPVAAHVAQRHPIEWRGISRMVNSYHQYGFYQVPPGFTIDAKSKDGVVEAVSAQPLNQYAIMWHPERVNGPDEWDILLFKQIFGEHSCAL